MFPVYYPYPNWQPQRPNHYYPVYVGMPPCDKGETWSAYSGHEPWQNSPQCRCYHDHTSPGYAHLWPQPQLMVPPPPPAYCFHYPSYPQPLPPHFVGPSRYAADRGHYVYDKGNMGHCCGWPNQACMKGRNSVKVEEENEDPESKKFYESPDLQNCPYPVVWIPPGWKKNNENFQASEKDPKALTSWFSVEKAKDNVQNESCGVEKKEKPEEMRCYNFTDLQNFPCPIILIPPDWKESNKICQASERDSNRSKGSVQNENGGVEKSDGRLPFLRMPGGNHGDDKKEIEGKLESGVMAEPIKVKSIPVKVLENHSSSHNQVPAVKNSDNSAQRKVLTEETKPKVEIAQRIEDSKVDQSSNSKNPLKHSLSSQSSTSKLPPICLRVDPLPNKKRKNGSSRSPSPPGEKEKVQAPDQNSSIKVQPVEDKKLEAGRWEKVTRVFPVVDKNGKQEPETITVEKVSNVESGTGPIHIVQKDVAPTEKRQFSEGTSDGYFLPPKPREPPKKLTDEDAALLIQSVYRGFLVRKWKPLEKLRRIKKLQQHIPEITEKIHNLEISWKLESNQRETAVVGESIMSLLLQLDTIQGLHPVVREIRKSVARQLITLQEKLDALTAISADKPKETVAKHKQAEETCDSETPHEVYKGQEEVIGEPNNDDADKLNEGGLEQKCADKSNDYQAPHEVSSEQEASCEPNNDICRVTKEAEGNTDASANKIETQAATAGAGLSYLEALGVNTHGKEDRDLASEFSGSALSSVNAYGIIDEIASADVNVSRDNLLPAQADAVSESETVGFTGSAPSSTDTSGNVTEVASSDGHVSGGNPPPAQADMISEFETVGFPGSAPTNTTETFTKLASSDGNVCGDNIVSAQVDPEGMEMADANGDPEDPHAQFNESNQYGTEENIIEERIAPVADGCEMPKVVAMATHGLDTADGAAEKGEIAVNGNEPKRPAEVHDASHNMLSPGEIDNSLGSCKGNYAHETCKIVSEEHVDGDSELEERSIICEKIGYDGTDTGADNPVKCKMVHGLDVSEGGIEKEQILPVVLADAVNRSSDSSKENSVQEGYDSGLEGYEHGDVALKVKEQSVIGEEAAIPGKTETDNPGPTKDLDRQLLSTNCEEGHKTIAIDAKVEGKSGDEKVCTVPSEDVSGPGSDMLKDLVNKLMEESKKQLDVIQELNGKVRDLEGKLKRKMRVKVRLPRHSVKSCLETTPFPVDTSVF